MTTDYRALCAELLEALENAIRVIYHEDGTKHISTADAVIAKADAALAQPEPVGPSDEGLDEETATLIPWLLEESMQAANSDAPYAAGQLYLAATLLGERRPTPTPIPVSERLPGEEDFDSEGTCWMWHPVSYHYCLCRPDPSVHTHWLPAHALPLPAAPGEGK